MALPNEFERKLIVQMRNNAKNTLKEGNVDWSDMHAVRWLRARNYDFKKTEKMIVESKRWRSQNQVDRILDSGLDTFFKVNYPLHMGILDKRRRPVVILPIGKWDLKEAVKNGLASRFSTFIIQCMEAVMKTIENRDAMRKPCAMPITQFTVVVDFKDFHFSHLLNFTVLRAVYRILSILESNYPETLANCLCINCPVHVETTFHTLFNPMLSTKTVSKIHWLRRSHQAQGLMRFLPERELQNCEGLLNLD